MDSRQDSSIRPPDTIGPAIVHWCRPVVAVMIVLGCAASAVGDHSLASPSAISRASASATVDEVTDGRLLSTAKTPIQRSNVPDPNTVGRPAASPWGAFTVVGTLLACLYLAGRWWKASAAATGGRALPAAVNLLGTTPITPQSAVHVVQVGDRLLIVGSGPGGLRTLTEVTEAVEVAHIAHLCRAEQIQRESGTWLGRFLPSSSHRTPVADKAPMSSASAAGRFCDPSINDSPTPADGPSPVEAGRSHRGISRAAAWLLILGLGADPLSAQGPSVVGPDSVWSRADALASPPTPQQLFKEPAADRLTGAHRVADQPTVNVASRPDVISPDLTPSASSEPEVGWSTGLLATASPQGLSGTLRLGVMVGVMSLAPAILLMTTCYVRFIVVLGLVRQALGVQQFPPTQVLTALSLFLTGLVMWPVWSRSWNEGVVPYTSAGDAATEADFKQALSRTVGPVRDFMSRQIEAGGNTAAIDLLMTYQSAAAGTEAHQPTFYEDVPLQVLLPAYVLSELKMAFLIGFQLYLPFVVIDLLVSSVLASLGLGMLSPAVVSLPFKLLLFVLIDGWFLLVEVLLRGMPAVA